MEPSQARFWEFGLRAAAVAGLVHAGFLVVFLAVELWLLAAVNVLSVAAYAVAILLVHRGRPLWSFPIVALELNVHAWVATLDLGWHTGFGYYVVLAAVVALQTEHALWQRLGMAAACSVSFTALDLGLGHREPPADVADSLLMSLRVMNLVAFFALLVVLGLIYAHTVRSVEQRLARLGDHDALTGLRNRASFVREASTLDPELTCWVVFADVDHFKVVNDRFGHAVGDHALQHIARCLAACVRHDDLTARWGGEEFVALLPGTDLVTAEAMAQRLRRAVASPPAGLPPLSLTVGLAEQRPGQSLEQAMADADAALYDGKRAGRDRVVLSSAG